MVHTLARDVMALNQQIAELDKAIEARFREQRDFEVITSMPGLGVILGAEFLAPTGGDMSAFGTADRLAGFGGVAPVPRDSGKISGNLHRPRRYNRGLQRVFHISALSSIRHCDDSRRFYERKRAEGKRHIQSHPRPGPPPGQRSPRRDLDRAGASSGPARPGPRPHHHGPARER
jgi:transposase